MDKDIAGRNGTRIAKKVLWDVTVFPFKDLTSRSKMKHEEPMKNHGKVQWCLQEWQHKVPGDKRQLAT